MPSATDPPANPTDDTAAVTDSDSDTVPACAAVVPTGDAVNGFVATTASALAVYGGTPRLDGSLEITGDAITDLSALSALVQVDGTLVVHDAPNLTSLDGLDCLQRVGRLELRGLPRLVEIDALARLTTLAGPLTLMELGALRDVDGLRSLREVDALRLENLPALASVAGLAAVPRVPGDVTLRNLDHLGAIDGPWTLAEVDTLKVTHNADLASLAGLAALRRVHDGVHVENNAALTSLQGLEGLDAPWSWLSVTGNAALDDVDVVLTWSSLPPEITIAANPHVCAGDLLALRDAAPDASLAVGAACPEPGDDDGPVLLEVPEGPVPPLNPGVPHYQFVIRAEPGTMGVPVVAVNGAAFRGTVQDPNGHVTRWPDDLFDVVSAIADRVEIHVVDALGRRAVVVVSLERP